MRDDAANPHVLTSQYHFILVVEVCDVHSSNYPQRRRFIWKRDRCTTASRVSCIDRMMRYSSRPTSLPRDAGLERYQTPSRRFGRNNGFCRVLVRWAAILGG